MRRIVLSLIVLSYAVVATAAPAVMPVTSGSLAAGTHAHHEAAATAPAPSPEQSPAHCGEYAPEAEDLPCTPAPADCCEDSAVDCSSCVCTPLPAAHASAPEVMLAVAAGTPRAAPSIAPRSHAPPLLFRPPIV